MVIVIVIGRVIVRMIEMMYSKSNCNDNGNTNIIIVNEMKYSQYIKYFVGDWEQNVK